MTLSEKYEIIKPLGGQLKRKFGSVHLVINRSTEKLFVLKSIEKSAPSTVVNCFLFESNLVLNHIQLPESIDFSETSSHFFQVKSYYEGLPLNDFWKTVSKKKQRETFLKIIESLASPLAYLAEKKIVHCDLKPGNIIIDVKNEKITASIIDFGMAIDETNLPNRSTIFSLGYASPELILNKLQLLNHTSDLFAFGIIAWQLFTETLPFAHGNPAIMTQLSITLPLPEHSKISKSGFLVLKKLCEKPLFKTSPNRMNELALLDVLKNAQSKRYLCLQDFIEDWKATIPPKKFFFF